MFHLPQSQDPLTQTVLSRLDRRVAVVAAVIWSQVAWADDPPKELPPLNPIAIVNFANLERTLGDVGRIFEMVDRPDIVDVIDGLLADNAGGLKGLNPHLPFGAMIFLGEILPPSLSQVLYFPIDNFDDFVESVRSLPATVTKRSEVEYELEREDKVYRLVLQNDYAILGEDEFLDRKLPDFKKLNAALTTRYDVAASVQLNSLPPLIRQVFTTYLSSQMAAQLQQRDHESDAEHQARYAQGMSRKQLLEQILRDGDRMTLGIDSSEDAHRVVIEFGVEARPDSEFAKYLTNIAGKSSFFEPLLSERHPLQFSVSWNADKREKQMLKGMVNSLQTLLTQKLPGAPASSVETLIRSLQATVAEGHVDAIFEYLPQSNHTMVFIGGLRVLGTNEFSAALRGILNALSEIGDAAPTVELDSHRYQDFSLHRLSQLKPDKRFPRAEEEQARLYGGERGVYLGTNNHVIWWGFGSKGVTEAIDRAIDATENATRDKRAGTSVPFRLVFRLGPWMDLPAGKQENMRGRELTQEALAVGDDALRIEFKPSETGGVLRLRFEEGFVRLLALSLAQFYDQSQM